MKKITRPATPAQATFACDVTGRRIDRPALTLTLHCGYGAPHDGDVFDLHLSPEAAEIIVPLLRVLLLGGRSLRSSRVESFFQDEISRRRLPVAEHLPRLLRQLQALSPAVRPAKTPRFSASKKRRPTGLGRTADNR